MSLLLYMDHHIDSRITSGLRQCGCDVLTAFEDGYDRRSDEDLLMRAAVLGRVVVTFDGDFLEITADWQAVGQQFAGLIFGQSRAMSVGDAIRDLELIVQLVSAEEIENTVMRIPL